MDPAFRDELRAFPWPHNWWRCRDDETAARFQAELEREVSPEHVLYGRTCELLGGCHACDDFLFYVTGEEPNLANVHLTFCRGSPDRAPWPDTDFYTSLRLWRAGAIHFGEFRGTVYGSDWVSDPSGRPDEPGPAGGIVFRAEALPEALILAERVGAWSEPRFVLSYSITDLLEHSHQFEWEHDCIETFDDLKPRLVRLYNALLDISDPRHHPGRSKAAIGELLRFMDARTNS